MKKYRIALIPGDGVGNEVLHEGCRVLEAAAVQSGSFCFEFVDFDWSCRYYQQHGMMMPPDGLQQLKAMDAIYLGAVGDPTVPDHISLWGLLLPIRKGFHQYVNLRPIRLLPGAPGPLAGKGPEDIDMVFVRENTEGEYAGIGELQNPGLENEQAVQTSVFTRKGTERIIRYAFEVASQRKKRLVGVTKSNALNYSMVYWDRIFRTVASEYPKIEHRLIHVDAMAMFMVKNPEAFDVIVASNLFGDILTDLGAALQGGMGFAAGANINPEKEYPSMFEPIHGSAPDIAGKGQANPIATIWAGSMMLEHLGELEAAKSIIEAVEQVVGSGAHRTPDAGGQAKTWEVGDAVIAVMQKLKQ
jgi:tartrate dehydrogenase/decarboxylase / D-malate dehydrogenase